MKPAFPFLVSAVLACGCGGGHSQPATTTTTKPAPRIWPRPAESAEQAAARIGRLATTRDCSSPRELLPDPAVTPAQCAKLLPYLVFGPHPKVRAFGSGAVVERASGDYAILALDTDRRYKLVTSIGFEVPVVPLQRADEYMSYVVGAIRRDACDEVLRYALAYPRDKRFCRAPALRKLHAALDRAYTASPTRLGGDGRFAFYGLRVKRDYFTLVFVAGRRGTYAFIAGVPA